MGDFRPDMKRRNSYWEIEGAEYTVGNVIGKGSFGEVSDCGDIISKRIKYDPSQQKNAYDSFLKEISLTGSRYEFAFGVHYPKSHTFVFSMPKIPGNPYKVVSKDQKSVNISAEYLTREDFLRNFFRIMVEVYLLHVKFGIIHRDIKLANLKIHNNQVYLLDFGMAYKIGEKTPATNRMFYQAPEFEKGVKADPKADVFSLGFLLVMFEREINVLLRLRDPSSTSLMSIPELKDLFIKMTCANPDERIDLLTAITKFVNFFNKSEFAKGQPISFDAKTIEQNFQPSSIPKVLASSNKKNVPPTPKAEKSKVTILEGMMLKRQKARPTLAPPPSPIGYKPTS